MSIDSNYLVIEDYLLDPIEWEVERALKYIEIDSYTMIPSISNAPDWESRTGRGRGANVHTSRKRLVNSI